MRVTAAARPFPFVPLLPSGALTLLAFTLTPLVADDWPHWQGPRRDGVWRETGIVEIFPVGGPRVLWRAPIEAGYSSPAVAGGRVFLTDRPGSTTRGTPGNPTVPTSESGRERVLCLDARDGRVLWQHEYDAPYVISYPSGPRASPAVAGDRVYTLGAEGDLHCFDVATGRVVWARNFKRDYGAETQTWGYASPPLVEGDRVFCLVGGEGHTVVAFDRHTGKELWRALRVKEAGYAPMTLIDAGGRRQLVVWESENLNGLDPATGEVFWSVPFKTKMAHAIGTPRLHDGQLFISSFFDGSLLLRLDPAAPRATEVWRIKGSSETRPEGLHSLMSTPWLEDGHIYGVCSFGHLRCVRLADGTRVWETLAATTPAGKPARWTSAFVVKHADRFFLYNETGDLIIARLTPQGYEEISRAHLLDPTNRAGNRPVHWSHPAFAAGSIFARNDRELIRVDLRAP
ncbi:MAG: PQQ-like beta-propeller repeat protein [Verrucomicrobia bacterium]|nr:PQQ-like beta-propeller repeat protein [Verrucomicrobiota bacterium]